MRLGRTFLVDAKRKYNSPMLNITELLSEEFTERLRAGFKDSFGKNLCSSYSELITKAARTSLEVISHSDTLYHDVEHTIYVTLVGQEILSGRVVADANVSQEQWLNVIIALLCHDIGYVRGICADDDHDVVESGLGEQVPLARGKSNAALMPYHVDRSKVYVRQAFSGQPGIDVEFIYRSIERTRFPVPETAEYKVTDDYPGLVRGADLIGQLSDPRYLYKLPAVFFEFEEIGFNKVTGYRNPGDLIEHYSDFYKDKVEPYIGKSVSFLRHTDSGRKILKNLYANVEKAERTRDLRKGKILVENGTVQDKVQEND